MNFLLMVRRTTVFLSSRGFPLGYAKLAGRGAILARGLAAPIYALEFALDVGTSDTETAPIDKWCRGLTANAAVQHSAKIITTPNGGFTSSEGVLDVSPDALIANPAHATLKGCGSGNAEGADGELQEAAAKVRAAAIRLLGKAKQMLVHDGKGKVIGAVKISSAAVQSNALPADAKILGATISLRGELVEMDDSMRIEARGYIGMTDAGKLYFVATEAAGYVLKALVKLQSLLTVQTTEGEAEAANTEIHGSASLSALSPSMLRRATLADFEGKTVGSYKGVDLWHAAFVEEVA